MDRYSQGASAPRHPQKHSILKQRHSERSSELSGIYRSLSSDWLRSLRSAVYRSWQIRQPAPQSKLRELRQRTPARCKGPQDHLLITRYACFVRVAAIKKLDFLAEAGFSKRRPDIGPIFWPTLKTKCTKKREPVKVLFFLCGLWVPTKEHQTRVQTFPIFPKGFQVLT